MDPVFHLTPGTRACKVLAAPPVQTRQPARWLLLLALAVLTAIGLHFDERRSPGPPADSTTAR